VAQQPFCVGPVLYADRVALHAKQHPWSRHGHFHALDQARLGLDARVVKGLAEAAQNIDVKATCRRDVLNSRVAASEIFGRDLVDA